MVTLMSPSEPNTGENRMKNTNNLFRKAARITGGAACGVVFTADCAGVTGWSYNSILGNWLSHPLDGRAVAHALKTKGYELGELGRDGFNPE